MLKNTRGRWAALALTAAVGCAAVVAGGASARPAAAPKPSALSGQLRFVSHTASKVGFDALIHNFNVAYPNVKVEATYLPTGPTFAQALLAQVNSGNAPDILFTNPNASSDVPAPQLGEAGKLLDLSHRPFVKRIPKADRKFFVIKGKVYAEPLFKIASGINVNMTEFKKHGWAVPKTFNQVIDLCGKAKAAGGSLFAFPGQVTAEAIQNSMGAAFVFSKDPNWIQKKAAGKVSFATSPLWQTLFARAKRMADADCFQGGWQAAGVPDMTPLLASHRAFAQMAPSQGISSLRAALPNDTFVSVPFPGDKAADTRAMLGYNLAISVSASTQNKAAALAFIDFAGREGQSRLLATINGSTSLHDVNVGKFASTMAAYAPLVKAHKTVARPESLYPTSSTNTNFNTVASGILAGGKDVSDALKLLDDTWGK